MSNNTVLVLANSLSGLYSFRKEVMAAIENNGYSVVISTPHDVKEKEDFFRGIGCEFEFIEIDRRGTNPVRDLSLIRKYKKLIRKTRPLVILTYTIKPNIYGGIAARRLHIPQLANITGLGTAIENPGLLQKFTILMYRFGLKKAEKVFYQNSSIQAFCKEHHIGEAGLLLPGSGVNLEWHTFQEYPLENTRMKFNFIGRVMKDKGVKEYLEAAQYLRDNYPQTEFHILGACEEHYDDILKELQDKGVIVWHGAVSDVRPYIKDSWCTVHPSYHEGMANVLLETCAGGRPVIACDINGCKEAVDDGVNGYLCVVKDSDDLINKIEKFVLLPYEQKVKMGLAARKKMEQEFDRMIVIKAYLKEINALSRNKNVVIR